MKVDEFKSDLLHWQRVPRQYIYDKEDEVNWNIQLLMVS